MGRMRSWRLWAIANLDRADSSSRVSLKSPIISRSSLGASDLVMVERRSSMKCFLGFGCL